MSFLDKAFDGRYFDTALRSPDPCYKQNVPKGVIMNIQCTFGRDWDPLGLFVSALHGPTVLCFEVFC